MVVFLFFVICCFVFVAALLCCWLLYGLFCVCFALVFPILMFGCGFCGFLACDLTWFVGLISAATLVCDSLVC